MKGMTYLLFFVSIMVLTVISAAIADDVISPAELEALDYLGTEVEEASRHLMRMGEDLDDIYSELLWTSIADTFPAKFDLRDRGVVTPVKAQNPWGTCWSFATIAAGETSILSALGLTASEYAEKFGEEMDLSEKHLAWFTANPLPDLIAYPEGGYPYDPSQAGEGGYLVDGYTGSIFNLGGNYFLSTSSLASGVGIVKEKVAPYMSAEGDLDRDGDWSLPEELRFIQSFELRNANVLPKAAHIDENGGYTYNPAATEAIKSELLKGRAVGIAFKADQSMPELSPEETRDMLHQSMDGIVDNSDGFLDEYIDIRAGITDPSTVSDEQLRRLIRFRLTINELPEDTYDLDDFDHDQLLRILNSKYFSSPYKEIVEKEASAVSYMSFIEENDKVIYAQYTYQPEKANHAVTVVGWDDTFPAANFKEGHRPPADGAWIVKNSWGTEWGTDGYFYLSYYDMSICGIESFEFVTSDADKETERFSILEYDFMPAENISSTLFDEPVYTANIFEVEMDSVLQYVSAMTGDLNAEVTAAIYLLNEGAIIPTDGILLDTITESFTFAGYHRMDLSSNLLLPEGARIGIVVLERVPTTEGTKYALVNTSSLGEKAPETFDEQHQDSGETLSRYCVGIVNPGESFISTEAGRWIDWRDAIAHIGQMGDNIYIAYDNLPIKAYLYPWNEVELIHNFSEKVPAMGGHAAVCPEDGYTVLDLTGR